MNKETLEAVVDDLETALDVVAVAPILYSGHDALLACYRAGAAFAINEPASAAALVEVIDDAFKSQYPPK